ncbi:MAG: diacylglycerol kinase family protein [Oscillospiraceae bacterium]|nr:diacylglycerol kinase family protein [Oscillospiraceae bacterium]
MAKGYVIYNPKAGNGSSEENAKLLPLVLDEDLEYYDMTRITNYAAFLSGMEQDDYLVIVGGDGTLNRFVNDTAGIDIRQEILYYPTGTGNDFAKDLGKDGWGKHFSITQYIKNLPSVEVKGKRYRFINGVGFGIDGYCCQVGDEMKKRPGKKVNYTAIAIKGLLFQFNARNAVVTVDGKEYTYNKVWIAPTMHGRFYGGGMMAAPNQNRLDKDGKLSLMMFHGAGRLHTLCIFPSIFKGEHVKNTGQVSVHTGHEITVEFDRPTPLQIDGETILDVTSYTATSAKYAAAKKERGVVTV